MCKLFGVLIISMLMQSIALADNYHNKNYGYKQPYHHGYKYPPKRGYRYPYNRYRVPYYRPYYYRPYYYRQYYPPRVIIVPPVIPRHIPKPYYNYPRH